MPDTKLSALPAGAAVSAADLFYSVQGAGSVKVTATQLQTFIGSAGMAIGGVVTGGTTGSVLFIDGGSTLAQDNANLFYDAVNKALTIGSGSSTVTSSSPVFDGAQTWNNVASTFIGSKLNITNTASAAASLLQDWEIGGSSLLAIGVSGNLIFNGTATLDYNTTHAGSFTLAKNLFIDGQSVLNPLLERANRIAPWDDFDAADGTFIVGRVSPSGFTWQATGAGAATAVINKQGIYATGNCYSFLSDTAVITEVEVVFSWTQVAGQSGLSSTTGVVGFSTDPVNPISGTSKLLHLQYGSQSWNLLKSLTGPAGLVVPANPPVEINGSARTLDGTWYGTNLKIDGTRYKIRMVANVAASTVTLFMPDGLVLQYTDPDIATIMTSAQTAFWQCTGNGAAGVADLRINGSAIGPSKAGQVIEACSSKDTAILRGVFAPVGNTAGNTGYIARLITPQIIPVTANGWYTIATQGASTSNVRMGGIVTLWGTDTAGRPTFVKITVGCEKGIPEPYNTFKIQGYLGEFGGGFVDQFRISRDDTNSLIQLDLHVNTPNAANSTLYANYEGYFTVTASPVVGATALGTISIIQYAASNYSYEFSGDPCGNLGDLPVTAKVGTHAFVKNSNQTLTAGIGTHCVGGGTNVVPVFWDGSGFWIIG